MARVSFPYGALLWLFLVLAASSGGATKHFVSQLGFELDVPGAWNIEVPPSGVPVFFNYDPSRGLPQGMFPGDGAEIYLIPFSSVSAVRPAKTIDEWIAGNYRSNYANVSRRPVPDIGRASRVVEVESDFRRSESDPEPQHEISYYFVFNGSMFRLRLLYWRDDRNGEHLRAVARTMLGTMRLRASKRARFRE
jgi:hypothetical protein